MGLIGMNTHSIQEKNWGNRFIEKSAMDKNEYSTSADLGIGFSRLLDSTPDSWHHDKIANIIPNAERYSQVNLYIYSGYPIRSNGLTTLEIKFLE